MSSDATTDAVTPGILLLCCDLDRTLLPNGPAAESAGARVLFSRLCALPQVRLAYVSGRGRSLVEEAIAHYRLPLPDYAIGDVGTTLYEVADGGWWVNEDWHQAIAPDWGGCSREALAARLADLSDLRLQEPAKQNACKLSYYIASAVELEGLLGRVDERLKSEGVKANLIWSVDDLTDHFLLDILPASASKLHAIRFLMASKGYCESRTLFAGDSGNDLLVLTSGLQSVLVRNATEEVRRSALKAVKSGGGGANLYFARGGFLGMNGNYSAGVLEGISHFFPDLAEWLREQCSQTTTA